MTDQDSEPDPDLDAGRAVSRIEDALERIALHGQISGRLPVSAASAEIAFRLDALIAQLRTALDETGGAAGED